MFITTQDSSASELIKMTITKNDGGGGGGGGSGGSGGDNDDDQ